MSIVIPQGGPSVVTGSDQIGFQGGVPVYTSNGGPITALGSGGFGSDTIVQLPDSGATLVNALELLTALTVNTPGATSSNWIIKLIRAGTVFNAVTFDAAGTTMKLLNNNTAITTPILRLESSDPSGNVVIAGYVNNVFSSSIRIDSGGNMSLASGGAGSVLDFYIGGDFGVGTRMFRIAPAGAAGSGVQLGPCRFQEKTGASIAVATTITLGTDGSVFPLTVGTGTLNSIVTTNWQSGSHVVLVPPSGVTITHNVAGTGATILTPTAASIVTASKRAIPLTYDGTNWIVEG